MQRADWFEKTLILEKLRAGGEGDDRGWDGWMPSPTQCTWVWVNSESWWWTGRPDILRFMRSQRVGHDLTTELNWVFISFAKYAEVELLYHMVQHWLDGHESQWAPGVGDGQGGLACCDSWGYKESDMTEQLIWYDTIRFSIFSCLRSLHTVFYSELCQCMFLPTLHKGSLTSPTFIYFYFFDNSHPKKCKVIAYHGFDFHFLDD